MEKKKITGRLDKVIMGAIIGTAIGSVLGVTLAPKSGKETRKIIAEKGKQAIEKGKEFKDKIIENRKTEGQKTPLKKSFLRRIFGVLARDESEDLSDSASSRRDRKNLNNVKEIPVEPLTIEDEDRQVK